MKKIIALVFIICFFNAHAQLPAYVPTIGLTGFWVFSGNANDVSTNGHNGTVNGASLTTDRFSINNSAYSFNGSGDYIFTNYVGILDTNARAVSFWAKTTITNTPISAVAWGDNASSNSGARYECGFNYNANGPTIDVNYGAITYSANTNIGDNNWHHYIYQFSTPTLSLVNVYQDGILLTQIQHSFSPGTTIHTTNSFNVQFGNIYNISSQHYFSGSLDDIGIWNRTLTPCEIQQLYTSGTSGSGTISAIASVTNICSGGTTTLIASGPGPYTWTPGGATTSSVVVSPNTSTIYTLTSSCASSTTLLIHVSPTPTLTATLNPGLICAGTTATLTALGATTYSWMGSGAVTSSIVITPLSTSVYTVIGSNGMCSSTLIRVQNVLPVPVFSVSSSDTSICAGSTVVLHAQGPDTYTWQPNQGGPNYTVTPLVTTVYTVTGENNASCQTTMTWTIFVNTSLPLTASANPTVLCPGTLCTLTASGATTYTWLTGNFTGATAVVSPTTSTTYTVIGESGTCMSTATVDVKVGLDIAITSSGNLCTNNSISLSFSPTPSVYNAVWTGPGIVGSASTSAIAINAGGNYSVVVTDPLNGCTGTASIAIAGGANSINFSITPSSTLTCFPGPPINLLVSSSANYNWLPSANVTPSSGPLVSVSPSVTSTYTAIAQLGSCTGTAVITISVNLTPTVTAVSSSSAVCIGQTLSLTANGASDYLWLPGNLSGPSVTVSPLFAGSYTVTGVNGSCAESFTLHVSVLPVPQLATNVSPQVICTGFSSTLTVSGAPLLAWLIGDPPPLSNVAVVNPTVTGTYTAIGTNSLGCSSFITVQVNVIQSPVITAMSSNTSICAGETITLTAGGSANYTWMPGPTFAPTIFVNPGTSTTYTVISDNPVCSHATVFVLVNNCVNISLGLTNAIENPEEVGGELYRIRFTMTASNSSFSDLVNVALNNDLATTFPHPLTYTVVNAPTVTSKNSLLTANSSFNGNSDSNLTIPASSTLSATKRDTIVFTVLVRPNGFSGTLKNSVIGSGIDIRNITARDVSNNGFSFDPDNDGDPTNNNDVTPIELELIEFFIPEGFSPNDDGRNDLFVVKGLNGRTAKLTIFNRWGTKVFTKEGNDLTWDGKANVNSWGHDKLPPSTYYYIFEFSERKSKVITGFFVMEY